MRAILVALSAVALVLSVATAEAREKTASKTLVFRKSANRKITVFLRWKINTAAPFYSGKGPLFGLVISEGNRRVEVPKEVLAPVEDFWLKGATLETSTPGNYVFTMHYGVGESSPCSFEVVNYRYRSGRH